MNPFSFFIFVALLAGFFSPLRAQDNIVDKLDRERQEQTGTAITIIFDDSGSMNSDQKLAQAKAAFTTWLTTIPEEVKLSLITFRQGGEIIVPLGANNRAKITQYVTRLIASSGTPICAALRLAKGQIEERRKNVTPYERQVVLLFTDGEENQDPGGIPSVQKNIVDLRAANIEVAGVGFHGQGDYMNGVATRYYSANDAASLANGLSKIDAEIGDTSDIVVSDAELAEMKSHSSNAVANPIAKTPLMSATPQSIPATRTSHKWNFGMLVFLVVIILFLRSVFGRKK